MPAAPTPVQTAEWDVLQAAEAVRVALRLLDAAHVRLADARVREARETGERDG